MTNRQFARYWLKYENDAQAIARKLAKADEAVWDDLVQVGAMTLWQLDLTRITSNESGYIRRAMKNQMYTWLKRFKPYACYSLDAMFEENKASDSVFDVVKDSETGELALVDSERAGQMFRVVWSQNVLDIPDEYWRKVHAKSKAG